MENLTWGESSEDTVGEFIREKSELAALRRIKVKTKLASGGAVCPCKPKPFLRFQRIRQRSQEQPFRHAISTYKFGIRSAVSTKMKPLLRYFLDVDNRHKLLGNWRLFVQCSLWRIYPNAKLPMLFVRGLIGSMHSRLPLSDPGFDYSI